MNSMGTLCLTLLLGLAALMQLNWTSTARWRRLRRGQFGVPARGRLSLSRAGDNPERGDVPGWVMITLMSAVLVAALLALAGPALEAMFNQAMDKVGN